MIVIEFEQDTKYGVYRDAITLPDDHPFTDNDIEAMKQQRVDNWINAVENPPPEPPPETIEIDGVTYQKVN